MFHRTDDELPRTNNAVEGWHRGFQAHVSACHPVFWKFLEVLQKEETVVRVGILKMKVVTNLLHKEEDTLIATRISSELLMTSQIVKKLVI